MKRDESIAWPCVGGPLDGKLRAHPGDTFFAAMGAGALLAAATGVSSPQDWKFEKVRYALRATTRDRFIWVPA